ncbi:MAG: DNA primase [Rhodanobacter sp. 68-29]|nr:DNA primase [Rhodanobacter sp.]ODV27923.1 MAG: DNA primase [Rhodanobacter sp. SCN 68-63]OJY61393.1 MAG: DNA primase [Rhodanobacter sp. 68-29]
MINTAQILQRVDLKDLVERHGVELKKSGREWIGLCPFHTDTTPSFTVVPEKGFVHCFACGAHYDAIGFVMQMDGEDFVTACHKLGGSDAGEWARREYRAAPRVLERPPGEVWVPVYPVPEHAPTWAPGVRGKVWNVKRGRWWSMTPSRADAYRDAAGALMAYVLRVEMDDGGKITPAVTWCIGPDGKAQWCLQPLPEPRPLCGLDALAAKPDAPVLVVSGEKCRDKAARLLPMYAVVTWCGGDKGVGKTDWAPLQGRELVLWPDADDSGRGAMLGYVDGSGLLHEGVAQLSHRQACASLRVIDTSGQPKGWDVADAIDAGWTPVQIAGWARSRVRVVDVQPSARVVH